MIGAEELSTILRLPPPTAEQVAVIQAPLCPALVVAGAGSGKTETMAARVLFLVANGLVRPEQILGLTFTRKAASGLAARIRRRLRTLAASGVLDRADARSGLSGGEPEVSTYHSFGGRLIAEFGPLAQVEPASRVLSATGSWQMARRVVGRWDGDLETDLGPDQVTDRLLAMSGGLADHLIDSLALSDEIERVLAVLRAAPPSATQRGSVHSGLAGYLKRLQDRAWILPLVDAFTQAKRRAGVVDFADQMQVAAALVTGQPRIGEVLRDRFSVVLLDEYQDTGHAQRVILRAVFSDTGIPGRPSGHPVTAVGDPVQSIYSWRGASASNLPRFPTDFPLRSGQPAPTLTLSTSFRNPSSVLTVANEISAIVRRGAVPVQELRPRSGADRGDVRYGLFGTAVEEETWVAASIAELWETARAARAPGDPTSARTAEPADLPPSTAVLLRRRRDMEPMAAALRAVGLPVEVVGLGGLLSEPEIADLLALLQVLVDPTAGPAALRLLTGARWQLGMADLAALSKRAGELTPRRIVAAGADGHASVRAALAEAGSGEDIDSASLIDAISDPGEAERYSAEGFRRLRRLAGELHRLRGRLTLPLPDLVAELERVTGLDVEVRISSPAGRAHLDAFADVVAEFASSGGGVVELVEYLLTAAEREDGLAPGEVEPAPGRIQILTVHAAKGLEWEIVAVPHVSDSVFPGSRGSTWLGDAAQLPPSLRGDAADLPQLALPAGGDQKDMVEALAGHTAALKADLAVEERRLLYVAITRAERVLLVSGHQWGRTGSKPHGPSEFLLEVRAAAETFGPAARWAPAPADGEVNPLTSAPRVQAWPVDPLGDRRAPVRQGADRVLAALDRLNRSVDGDRTAAAAAEPRVDRSAGDPHDWARDVAALLAERRAARSRLIEVALPQSISATALVDLADDPAALARRIRRPVPHAPTPRARRGTEFHAWLERFYTSSALMEISDLPGALDGERVPDPEDERLKTRFQASSWARRIPFEIELPFSMTIGGQPVKGRIDAVFRDDDGGCTVVDWKTGRPPPADRRAAATVQLAVYRLAAAHMLAMPLSMVRAAFVYVALDEQFAPADLLDADGLAALLAFSTSSTGQSHDVVVADEADDVPVPPDEPDDGPEPPQEWDEPPPEFADTGEGAYG
ncbi:DNA helicase-2 / ATP-dependent DNA helicase PcrA [Nakamurella panacisegetis]|uniref:DNA 3'-5' helicase n=1 Tax=Nakamurella panacisegetis TaxID=1090615 RepID=A0A1H0SMH3_9ACTN|nr:ATP-dependent DNA helicase [Nakamurella panacisegetis]SDP42910.1 DNA helicase-2 / ATP-dependent DNA helicase PcrA [Nakamurella panacisegetis]